MKTFAWSALAGAWVVLFLYSAWQLGTALNGGVA